MYTQGGKANPTALFSAAAALSVFLLPLRGGAAGLLWRTLFNLISTLLSLFFVLLSLLPSPILQTPTFSPTSKPYPSWAETTCASRALSHVLSMVSLVPVSSRKYELVRSLAERLLDESTQLNTELNQIVLSDAFSKTLQRLEHTIMDGEWGMFGGAVKKTVTKWWPAVVVGEEREEGFGGAKAEKLAAELLWLGQKMAESGAVKEAVVRWGQAARLGSFAISAEPRLQVAFVRVTVFLLKHANSVQFEEDKGFEQEQERVGINQNVQMEILKSWLPLLCRATNGSDSPILNSREKMEMVRAIEELIEKLSWQQQEAVLAIWLHHFSASPDSDWPNLESCYTQWYSNSCKLLLK